MSIMKNEKPRERTREGQLLLLPPPLLLGNEREKRHTQRQKQRRVVFLSLFPSLFFFSFFLFPHQAQVCADRSMHLSIYRRAQACMHDISVSCTPQEISRISSTSDLSPYLKSISLPLYKGKPRTRGKPAANTSRKKAG